jgi:C4-dicarboxylate transporter DctQ subunit
MRQTWGRVLLLHDAVTRIGFAASAIIVALIAISFSYEVVARYFFGAPTSWANAFVAYFLCASIFLAAPELTRRRAHVAVTLLSDRASPGLRAALHRVVLAAGAGACLLATWITANATADQFAMGIDTISAYPVPKWLVSIFIPYGMLSSGLYFLRDLVSDHASAGPEPAR